MRRNAPPRGEEDDDEGVHDLTQDEAPRTPAEIAHDEELAAFQEQSAKREAALRMRIIAEGGSLLAS